MQKSRYLLIVIGLIIVGLISTLIFLHTETAKRSLVGRLHEYLNSRYDLFLVVGDIDYNLLTMSASARDISLGLASRTNLPHFFKANELDVDLSLLDLLLGSFTIEGAQLEGVSVLVIVDETGEANFPLWLTVDNEESSSDLELLFSSLIVIDGSFAFEDRARHFRFAVPEWAAKVSGEKLAGSHSVDFSAHSSVEVQLLERVLVLDQLEAIAEFDSAGLRLESLEMRSDQSSLEMSGLIPVRTSEQLDLQAAASFNTVQFSKLLEFEEPVSGSLECELTLQGSIQDPILEAHLKGKELSWRTIDSVEVGAELEWKIKEDLVTVKETLVTSPRGSILGAGQIALTDEAGSSQATLRVTNLDLRWLSELLGSKYRVASLSSGDVRLSWPGLKLARCTGKGTLSLAASGKSVRPSQLPVSGALSFSATQEEFRLAARDLETASIHWTGQAAVGKAELLKDITSAQLSGRISGYAADVGTSIGKVADLLGDESADLLPVRGRVEFVADLSGTVENPHTSFKLQALELESFEVRGIELQVEGEIDRRQVAVSRAFVQWRGGRANLAGSLALNQPEPELEFTGSLDTLPLRDVATALRLPISCEGEVNAEVFLTGAFWQPELRLEANVANLQLADEKLGTFSVSGSFEKNVLDLSTITLSKPAPAGSGEVVTASGHLDFSNDTFLFEADARQLEISALRLAQGWTLAGLLDLSAQGKGTLDNPEVDLDLRMGSPSISGYELAPIQVDAVLQDSQFEATALAADLGLSAQASGTVNSPYPMRISVKAEGSDVSRLPFLQKRSIDLTGSVAGDLQAEGDLSDWRRARLSTTLTDLRLVWNGVEVSSLQPINLLYKDESLLVERSVVAVGGGSLEIEGSLPLERAHSDSRLVTDLSFNMADLLKILPSDWQVEGTGDLDVQIEAAGSLTEPELSGQLRISKSGLTGSRFPVPITDLEIEVSFQHNAIQLDQLSANAGGGTLSADGVLLDFSQTPKNEPICISVSLEGFPLESLGVLPERMTGLATAQVELTSQEVNLPSLVGVVAFGELQLTAGDLTLRQTDPVLLSLQNGQIWLERVEFTGPDSQVRGSGGIDFLQPGALELELEGSVSTSLLAELIGNVESSGESQLDLVVGGLPGEPQLSGTFVVEYGTLLVPSHDLQVDELKLQVRAEKNHLQIESFSGELNGGSFEGDGTAHYAKGKIEAELLTVITDVYLDWPQGLRTISDGVIALRSTEEGFLLDGELRILEGAYRERFDLEGSLFQYLKTGRQSEIDLEPDPLLSGLGFEIGIETIDPILVDNNLAELVLQGRVDLRGNYYRPGMKGVITVEPGGEVFLRGKTYVVEHGAISFLEDNRIRPDLNLRARTKAKEYDVTLQAVGPIGNIKTSFSSEPALAEPDIVSVLLTGRTLEELRGAEASVATEQALSLLVGAAGREAESAIGLTKVRIEPYLIAPESTPEARLTLGQDLTSDLRAIYSLNLADSGDQIWVAEYDLTRRFRTRGIKQSDNTYRFDFSHQLRLGTTKRANLFPEQRLVGAIQFEGSSPFTETLLRETFKVKTDQMYDFFKTQKGLEKIQGLFSAKDLLEARIRLRRAEANDTVDLTVKIETGLTVILVFEGDKVSTDTQKRVRELWSRGVSDTQRQRESLYEIRRGLVQQGHLKAATACRISLAQNRKGVTFHVEKGPEFRQIAVAFEGVEAFERDWLQRQLDEADLVSAVFLEPRKTTDFLEALYRRRGYLEVNTDSPKLSFDEDRSEAKVVLEITEGPLYRVGKIQFQGNRVIDEATLRNAIGVKTEDVYYPGILGDAVARLEELYLSKGYNRSQISDTAQRAGSHSVDLAIQIVENIQDIVAGIEISGQRRVNADFIRRQMGVEIGEVLDLENVSRARKSLYDTGAFSLVEIEPVEIEQAEARDGTKRSMRLQVRVRESIPHTINYGAFYDTDRGLGLTGDYRNHNLLRNGRVFGVRGRFDADRRELRGYFSQPARRWFPLRTHASAFAAQEFRPSFEFDQVGFTIEEQAELKETLIGSFGFSFIKNRVQEREADSMLEDLPLNVGALNTALAWDTRDSFLDATRGHFFSSAFQFAPTQFGSDFPFVKYFGSYSRYFPLTKPSKIPFGGDFERPRLIFATGVRLGLAKGFDQDIISPTERFFAGGGTTIRGFRQDAVGPVNDDGVPIGGNSLFVWNNELRFPMFSILEGVGFLDIGNVYSTVSDFNPLEVREAAGFGLRVRTPFFLVRFDYGFKLDRRPGESRGAFFFSIGQAF